MWENVTVVILVVAAILLVFWLVSRPFKLLKSLVVKSVVGVVLIFLANYVGSLISFTLPYNLASVPIAGFLGLPGLALLAYLRYITG
jgi:inhibitor of the pro-sigma K processing machinery